MGRTRAHYGPELKGYDGLMSRYWSAAVFSQIGLIALTLKKDDEKNFSEGFDVF